MPILSNRTPVAISSKFPVSLFRSMNALKHGPRASSHCDLIGACVMPGTPMPRRSGAPLALERALARFPLAPNPLLRHIAVQNPTEDFT